MSAEEQAEFETRMDRDPALEQEVQNWLATKYIGFEKHREQFRISEDFPQEAAWFSCLALIQLEDWPSSKQALDTIARGSSSHFQPKAQTLLKKVPVLE
ncbi:MAG: hypothetical protein AAF587_06710 [Bacteroidota bacterium]